MARSGNGAGAGKPFLPFEQALVCARSLKLKSKAEWIVWSKSGGREANIPTHPERSYKNDGWHGYGHWLGTGNLAGGKVAFLPFKKALVYARSLKLTSQTEWNDWGKTGVRPKNIPSHPYRTYKQDGWQGYGHWLGTGTVAPHVKQFLPFKKALLYACSLELKGVNEWRDWAKTGGRPANMPSHPERTYKHEGWRGYGHWLGTGAVANQDK